MTLQDILRGKDNCGGCKTQSQQFFGGPCKSCKYSNLTFFKPNDGGYDQYQLDIRLKEIESLAEIGRDFLYLSNHEEVTGLPTVHDLQKLAEKRRAQERVKP